MWSRHSRRIRRDLKQSHTMRTKRKAIAIIKGDHVLIREQPPIRRMEFSEATGLEANSLGKRTGNYFDRAGNFGAGTANFSGLNRNRRQMRFSVHTGHSSSAGISQRNVEMPIGGTWPAMA